MQQALDEGVEVAVHHALHVGGFLLGAQILHHLVWMEHVIADLVAPGSFHDIAADVCNLGGALFLGNYQQLGHQQGHGLFFVLQLGALLGAAHGQACWDVQDAHGRLHLVDVLAAGTARAAGGDLQVFVGDVELHLRLDVGHHLHTGKTRLALVVCIKRADPHQPVGALFVAQVAVGVAALDLDRAALDARLFPFTELVHAHLHAVVFGPAGVHAHQHQGPVLGVGAAGAGVDADHGALLVVGAREQALQLPAIQIGP